MSTSASAAAQQARLINSIIDLSFVMHDYDHYTPVSTPLTTPTTVADSNATRTSEESDFASWLTTTSSSGVGSYGSLFSTSEYNPFSMASSSSSSLSSLSSMTSASLLDFSASLAKQEFLTNQDLANNNHKPQSSFVQQPALPMPEAPKKVPPPTPSEPRCTESVRVASSAHVSYIVGRQGAKIRAIRLDTETLIQTPVNGEEPIFVLRGRRSNVAAARDRILAEARAYDNSLFLEACSYKNGARRRLNLYLPSRYIGLVVGKHGNAIKRIMAVSGAQVVTPKVNTLNGFKIEGTEVEIRRAVDLIKKHIVGATSSVAIAEQEDNMFEIHLDVIPLQQQGATNK